MSGIIESMDAEPLRMEAGCAHTQERKHGLPHSKAEEQLASLSLLWGILLPTLFFFPLLSTLEDAVTFP